MKRQGSLEFHRQRLHVFTDGAIRPDLGVSGLAAVVRDEQDRVRYLWSKRTGPLTCNEAEYEAVIMALESLYAIHARQIAVFSDSRILVDQMSGNASVKALTLRSVHARLRSMIVNFETVSFNHIPRVRNRLADALANDAAEGRGC